LDDPLALGEAISINAVFMPRSYRVLGVPGIIHMTEKATSKKFLIWKKAKFQVTGDSQRPVGRNKPFPWLRKYPIKQHFPY
jgi:hypothetical protein